jgi:predicted secreted protein
MLNLNLDDTIGFPLAVTQTLDVNNNGSDIFVAVGEVIKIELTQNGSSGYIWSWDHIGNPLQMLVTSTMTPADSLLMGPPSLVTIYLKPMAPINRQFEWHYIQPANPDTTGTQILKINLRTL